MTSNPPDIDLRFAGDDALLAWVGEGLIAGRDPEDAARAICTALGRHLGASRVTYGEVDAPAGRITVPWDYADGTVSAVGSYPLRAEDWHIIEYSRGRTVAYADWEPLPLTPPERREMTRSGNRAILCVPSVADGRLVGVFSVMDRRVRAWTDREIALVERIARMLSATLDHLRTIRRLEASETLFRTLAESLPGICWVGGPDGNAFWMNDYGREIFEVEWLGQESIAKVVHPDDLTVAAAGWRHAVETATASEVTVRVRTGDGQYRPMLSRTRPAFAADGGVRYWIGLLVDLTEERLRMRGENLLRELSEATRDMTDAVAILDTTCRMLGEHLGATRVDFSETDPETGSDVRVASVWGARADVGTVDAHRLGALFPDAIGRLGRGETVVVSGARDGPEATDPSVAMPGSVGIRSGIGVPLLREGRLAAILSVTQGKVRLWSDDEIRLVEGVAERAWATLGRARAERALKQRERMQQVLLGWSDAVRAQPAPRSILALTLATIGRELGVVRVNFAEAEEDGDALIVEQDWVNGAASVAGQRFPLAALGERVVAEHLRGLPFRTDDARVDPRVDPATMAIYDVVGARAFVSIPLLRGERLIGVLSVQSDRPRRWTDAEVALLAEMAERTWAILERARSEERLAESEALLAAYLTNAPIAMYLTDADGRYIRINDEMANMLGVTVEQAIGRTAFEVSDQDLAARVTALDHQALHGDVQSGILDFGERDRYQTLLSIRFPIPSRDGTPTKLGGFTLDLTDQTRAEAALRRSRDALYQSEKLNALGSLLAGVSHELNNPLSIVVAQAVMMERQAAGGVLAERAYKIRKAADRCARIVQTFLAMARQREPERKPVDINAVVLAALELADYGLKTDGVATTTALSGNLPQIAADADQLHQVVINLVVNAQQAMVDAGVADRRIHVTSGPGHERDTVAIDIVDTGPGIAIEARRRVFEPFFTTKPQGQGTGVGLSFSQGLVEAHGGRLELVDSASGAHFRLTLPVDGQRSLPTAIDAAPAPAPTIPMARRALVIDDEGEIAESLADFLDLEGFACDIVPGGRVAIDRLATGTDYDLIVSDLRMPDVDGPAVYAWILANRPELAVRTAFATGDTLGAAVSRFIAGVGRPVLEKPFMPDGVQRLLRQMET